MADAATGRSFADVEQLLEDARSRIERVEPDDAARRVAGGALLVDIRPQWQRAVEGEVPGSWIVERNHLEWRLHPDSDSRLGPAAPDQPWLVMCSEGYTSSLAADALRSLGVPAGDVTGGFHAWRAAGLPTRAGVTEPDTRVPD